MRVYSCALERPRITPELHPTAARWTYRTKFSTGAL
eukprot:SAG22_NODE_17778_length_298_cov_1.271357_1_plen_35_part_01